MVRSVFKLLRYGATALSLLLCVATALLIVRSFLDADGFKYEGVWMTGEDFYDSGIECAVLSSRGIVLMTIATPDRTDPLPAEAHWKSGAYHWAQAPQWGWRGTWMGFYYHNSTFVGGRKRSTEFPLYAPLLIFAAAPALWLRNALTLRRRRRLGLCPQCGYDLRAGPSRCPECGWAAAQHHG